MDILKLKQSNCMNCYKCIRECPVKSISFDFMQANIISEDCILCGKCVNACPQNAKKIRNDVDRVIEILKSGKKVIASVAPSFPSFNSNVFNELYQIGFDEVIETAEGAALVTRQYEDIARRKSSVNIITSACPTVVSLVTKYYPMLTDQLAAVLSPMNAHARMIREKYGEETKVIFFGPCISKKKEGDDDADGTDAVLTYEEYNELIAASPVLRTDEYKKKQGDKAMFYPVSGGIIKSLRERESNYSYMAVDGMENCIEVLDSIQSDGVRGYFIEMSACKNSCINGPCINHEKTGILKKHELLDRYARTEISKVQSVEYFFDASVKHTALKRTYDIPGEERIAEILLLMGKDSKEKQLNCQACGYASCREKAIAVYRKKADPKMCLPYMRERAESISNEIIRYTPNAIIALNEKFEVQEMNPSALSLFSLSKEKAKGKFIGELMDETIFYQVVAGEENVFNKKVEISNYGLILEISVIYVKKHQLILTIMKDITAITSQKMQMVTIRDDTVAIASEVIRKQMRVAQEIASLLGETTAETKIALTKLKEIIVSQEVE